MDIEKLLLTKGIQVITIRESDNVATHFAYNDNLLGKNILIQFFECELAPPTQKPVTETSISALTHDDKVSHDLTLYYRKGARIAPIELSCIIADIVDQLRHLTGDSVMRYLMDISRGGISSAMQDEPAGRSIIYREHTTKIKRVIALIREKRIGLN